VAASARFRVTITKSARPNAAKLSRQGPAGNGHRTACDDSALIREPLKCIIEHQDLGARGERDDRAGVPIRVGDHNRGRHQFPMHQRFIAAYAAE
jgi:hypothetical protein